MSGVTFVAMTTLVKHLSGDYPSHVQNFYRQTGSLIVANRDRRNSAGIVERGTKSTCRGLRSMKGIATISDPVWR